MADTATTAGTATMADTATTGAAAAKPKGRHPYKDVSLWSIVKPGLLPFAGIMGFIAAPHMPGVTRARFFGQTALSAAVILFGNQLAARYTSYFE